MDEKGDYESDRSTSVERYSSTSRYSVSGSSSGSFYDPSLESLPQREQYGEGTIGRSREILTNSFRVAPKIPHVYSYLVECRSLAPGSRLRIDLLCRYSKQLNKVYGINFVDMNGLYALNRVNETQLFNLSGHKFKISFLQHMEEHEQSFQIQSQLFHIVLRNLLEQAGLKRIGRLYFEKDENGMIPLSVDGVSLNIQRGYSLTMDHSLFGWVLTADCKFRIINRKSIRDDIDATLIRAEKVGLRGNDGIKFVKDEMKRSLYCGGVISSHNNRVWRIDDIDFNLSRDSTFVMDERKITFKQYFLEKYGVHLKCKKPGFLVYRKKGKEIFLPPEICFQTGLTPKLKDNHKVMQELHKKMSLLPKERLAQGEQIAGRIKKAIEGNEKRGDDEEQEIPCLQIEDEPIRQSARELPEPRIEIRLKNGTTEVDAKDLGRSWNRSFFVNKHPKRVKRILILADQRDQRAAKDFVSALQARMLEFGSSKPKDIKKGFEMITIEDGNVKTWKRRLHRRLDSDSALPDVIIGVLPRKDTSLIYSQIKDLANAEFGIVSQCIQVRNIGGRKFHSICHNIFKQIMVKLGDIPWRTKFDLPNKSIQLDKPTMLVGMDVCHDWKKSHATVGFVSSYGKSFDRYYGTVKYQKKTKEIIIDTAYLLSKGMKKFKKENGKYPKNLIVFRDGVANSQLETVVEEEILQMEQVLKDIGATKTLLLVLVVQKRISQKFLTLDRTNVKPGTVIDQGVVSSRYCDFFLTTTQAPRGKTVTPTRYIILRDDIGVHIDDIQMFVRQLCSQYYNWPGSIRIPAPVMYADKIADVYGAYMRSNETPHRDLSKLLHYL